VLIMDYVFLALVAVLAGIVPEITGFGVATVAMSLLPLVFPLETVIPLVTMISVLVTGLIAWRTNAHEALRRVVPLLVGSIFGVALGMIFLKAIDSHAFLIALAAFLISYGAYGLLTKEVALPAHRSLTVLVGFVAGFFSASFNVHGPLVGMYVSGSRWFTTAKHAKGTVAMYMFFVGSFTLVGHALSRRITSGVLWHFLLAVPFLLLGMFVGRRLFHRVSARLAKQIICVMAMMAGVVFLFR
jgi:hypothetical protein